VRRFHVAGLAVTPLLRRFADKLAIEHKLVPVPTSSLWLLLTVVRFINKWLSIIQRHREIEGAGQS
jgi:hypothetical protein